MASTSSVGRHGLPTSTAKQWYTTPSKTDRALMRTLLSMAFESPKR